MLTLRKEWQSITGGAVALDLVSQVRRRRLRRMVASELLAASFDLLVATLPARSGLPLSVERTADILWRINDCHFMYLPEDDDLALAKCLKLARSSLLTVILPRRCESLKRRLLPTSLGNRSPNVWSLDGWISWRMLQVNWDQGWTDERALLELFAAYNRHIQAATSDDSLIVDLAEYST